MIKLPAKIDQMISNKIRTFTPETIKSILKTSEDDWITKTHFGIGLFIRNDWIYYDKKESIVYKFFKKHFINQPDDMSAIILAIIYRRVHEQPDNIDELVQYYIDYWKEKKDVKEIN